MDPLKDQAIKAALNQDWPLAIEINHQILASQSDIPTLNRLGFAYMQLGDTQKAKDAYNQVLEIDKYNPIATKSLEKLKQFKAEHVNGHTKPQKFITTFIEEPGKTKTITLVRPANHDILLTLNPGFPVTLTGKKHRVVVETDTGKYIGCLPDDIGHKLGRLIGLGYSYQAIIKSANHKSVSVFIKEISRSKKGRNLPSFGASSASISSLPQTEPLDEIPIDFTPTGEEDSEDS